jgi:hypothetical protein
MECSYKNLNSKLSRSYYAMQSLKGIASVNTLQSMYFANFHSQLRYGILLWRGDGESNQIFKLQKKVMRLISKVERDTTCRELLRH